MSPCLALTRRQLVVGLLSASRSRLSLMSDEALLGMAGSMHLMPGGCDDDMWKEVGRWKGVVVEGCGAGRVWRWKVT